eukprot:COSAG06_NODE_3882_length_4808_cov_2.751327_3_plen_225_part_00
MASRQQQHRGCLRWWRRRSCGARPQRRRRLDRYRTTYSLASHFPRAMRCDSWPSFIYDTNLYYHLPFRIHVLRLEHSFPAATHRPACAACATGASRNDAAVPRGTLPAVNHRCTGAEPSNLSSIYHERHARALREFLLSLAVHRQLRHLPRQGRRRRRHRADADRADRTIFLPAQRTVRALVCELLWLCTGKRSQCMCSLPRSLLAADQPSLRLTASAAMSSWM